MNIKYPYNTKVFLRKGREGGKSSVDFLERNKTPATTKRPVPRGCSFNLKASVDRLILMRAWLPVAVDSFSEDSKSESLTYQ